MALESASESNKFPSLEPGILPGLSVMIKVAQAWVQTQPLLSLPAT